MDFIVKMLKENSTFLMVDMKIPQFVMRTQ